MIVVCKNFLMKNFFTRKLLNCSNFVGYGKEMDIYRNTNQIIIEASELIYLIISLRQNKSQALASCNYYSILEKIDNFTKILDKYHFSNEQIDQTRYLICAALDEAAADNRLVNLSEITSKGFVNYFYKEGLGGEKFFKIIESISEDISRNISLICFAYLLLRLGFKGKYGIMENGLITLKEMQHQLYLLLLHYKRQHGHLPNVGANRRNNQTLIFSLKICTAYTFIILITYGILGSFLSAKQKQMDAWAAKLEVEKCTL